MASSCLLRNWVTADTAPRLSSCGNCLASSMRLSVMLFFPTEASSDIGCLDRNSWCSDLNDCSTLCISPLIASRLWLTLPSFSAATQRGGSRVTENEREHLRAVFFPFSTSSEPRVRRKVDGSGRNAETLL